MNPPGRLRLHILCAYLACSMLVPLLSSTVWTEEVDSSQHPWSPKKPPLEVVGVRVWWGSFLVVGNRRRIPPQLQISCQLPFRCKHGSTDPFSVYILLSTIRYM